MVMGENAYWVEAKNGGIECPQCHTIINAEDFDSYKLIDVDGSCCGDIFGVTIKCVKCGAIIEVI
jgi:hypothetical protein